MSDYENDYRIIVADDVDTVLEWREEGDLYLNKCRLRIFWFTWDTAIVIASELSDNHGKQITFATTEIIERVNNLYNLVPNKIMFVEHYPVENKPDEDIYLQVLLTKNEAVRYEIKRHKLTELIGKPISG